MEELLTVLEGFEYSTTDRNALIGDDIKVSYMVDTNDHNVEEYPLQVVVRVHLDGMLAYTYGCTDNDMNAQFIKWFLTNKYRVERFEDSLERAARNKAEEKFNALLDAVKK
jgi:hypothetical protein